MPDPEPTTEELEREKLMLEVEKLRQDIELQRKADTRELWKTAAVVSGAIIGSASVLATAIIALSNWMKGG